MTVVNRPPDSTVARPFVRDAPVFAGCVVLTLWMLWHWWMMERDFADLLRFTVLAWTLFLVLPSVRRFGKT